jgi:hypothetical protein
MLSSRNFSPVRFDMSDTAELGGELGCDGRVIQAIWFYSSHPEEERMGERGPIRDDR